MSRKWGCIPVIICGDLNCVPQVRSQIRHSILYYISLRSQVLIHNQFYSSFIWQSPLYKFFASSMVSFYLNHSCSFYIGASTMADSFEVSFNNFFLLQLDIRLHDRRNISGQLEFESEYRGFKFHNENNSR